MNRVRSASVPCYAAVNCNRREKNAMTLGKVPHLPSFATNTRQRGHFVDKTSGIAYGTGRAARAWSRLMEAARRRPAVTACWSAMARALAA